jgi:hypothetical protein
MAPKRLKWAAVTVSAAFRYFTASSGFANCAAAEKLMHAALMANKVRIVFFMAVSFKVENTLFAACSLRTFSQLVFCFFDWSMYAQHRLPLPRSRLGFTHTGFSYFVSRMCLGLGGQR